MMAPVQTVALRVVLLAIIVVAIGTAAFVVIEQANRSRVELPVLGSVPPFELMTQDGELFTREDLLGKLSVVDFMFTRCKGPCPIMSGFMANLYEKYANTDEIQFVSISVDPENDTLAALRQYAADQGVTDNRWVFLRGEIDSIKVLSEQGFMLAADDLPGMHSTKFVLVDREGNIRGYYSGTDEKSIAVLQTHLSNLARQ